MPTTSTAKLAGSVVLGHPAVGSTAPIRTRSGNRLPGRVAVAEPPCPRRADRARPRRPSGLSTRTSDSRRARGGCACCSLAVVSPVGGHDGGTARSSSEPTGSIRAASCSIRGEDHRLDEAMRSSLAGRDRPGSTLGQVATDGRGPLQAFIAMPRRSAGRDADAVEPHGRTRSSLRLGVAVSIRAAAPGRVGDGARPRDGRRCAAPAPRPIRLHRRRRSRAPPVARGADRCSAAAGTSDIDLVPFVALALAIGALGFLVWRTAPARPRPPRPGRIGGLALASGGDPRTRLRPRQAARQAGRLPHEGRPGRRRVRRQGAEPAQPRPLATGRSRRRPARSTASGASSTASPTSRSPRPTRSPRRCCSRRTSSSATGRASTSGSRTTRATRTSRSPSATSSRASSGRASSSTTAAATSGRTRRRRASTSR